MEQVLGANYTSIRGFRVSDLYGFYLRLETMTNLLLFT